MENIGELKKFWSKKRVLITGHTGFKGSWLSIILTYLNSTIHGYSLKPRKNSLFNKSTILKKLRSNTYSDINNLTKLKIIKLHISITKIKKQILMLMVVFL